MGAARLDFSQDRLLVTQLTDVDARPSVAGQPVVDPGTAAAVLLAGFSSMIAKSKKKGTIIIIILLTITKEYKSVMSQKLCETMGLDVISNPIPQYHK